MKVIKEIKRKDKESKVLKEKAICNEKNKITTNIVIII